MEHDDFLQEAGDPPLRAGRGQSPEVDELNDAAERLGQASWNGLSDQPGNRRGGSSGFLSGDDVGRVRALLEDQLRERPLPILLLAVAAGWIAGKFLR
jgi:hypothetical protein